jgi:nucleoside-diphosphate-sugar epimerase
MLRQGRRWYVEIRLAPDTPSKAKLSSSLGIEGFIHVASPVGGISDVHEAIALATNAGLNALKACAKVPSCKNFVFTSSSLAATFPRPNVEFSIDENTYNDEALEILEKEPGKPGLFVYAAMKTETEKAIMRWMEENQPDFVLNRVVSRISHLLGRMVLILIEKKVAKRKLRRCLDA